MNIQELKLLAMREESDTVTISKTDAQEFAALFIRTANFEDWSEKILDENDKPIAEEIAAQIIDWTEGRIYDGEELSATVYGKNLVVFDDCHRLYMLKPVDKSVVSGDYTMAIVAAESIAKAQRIHPEGESVKWMERGRKWMDVNGEFDDYNSVRHNWPNPEHITPIPLGMTHFQPGTVVHTEINYEVF